MWDLHRCYWAMALTEVLSACQPMGGGEIHQGYCIYCIRYILPTNWQIGRTWTAVEHAPVTRWRKKVSRKDGLSLIRREEQGDAVSEILGDLDGHLVRSWIVSILARAMMMCCSVWTYYCRTAEEYSFTVERERISRRRRLHLDSIIIFLKYY